MLAVMSLNLGSSRPSLTPTLSVSSNEGLGHDPHHRNRYEFQILDPFGRRIEGHLPGEFQPFSNLDYEPNRGSCMRVDFQAPNLPAVIRHCGQHH